jgi:spoIIIJ-associated protein
MRQIEIGAQTVEEATQRALVELGLRRDQVEIEVLSEGKSGILGIGKEEARVRATVISSPSPHTPEVAGVAQGTLATLLAYLELVADIQLETGVQVADEEETSSPPLMFDISGDDLGLLIGRRGQTLAALQYIERLIVAQKVGSSVPLVLDVNGYKKRRYESLRTLAQHVAEQVAVSQRPCALEPMPAYERRIVHLALATHPAVMTQSVGFGDARKVTVVPRENSHR